MSVVCYLTSQHDCLDLLMRFVKLRQNLVSAAVTHGSSFKMTEQSRTDIDSSPGEKCSPTLRVDVKQAIEWAFEA